MKLISFPIVGLAMVSLHSAAIAGSPLSPSKDPIATPSILENDNWKFTLGLPGWLAGFNGDVGVLGMAPVHSEFPFSKMLENLDMVASLSFEAQKGPWSFYAEGLYMKLSVGGETPGRLLNTINVDLTQVIAEAEVGYRLWESNQGYFDLIAGARYYSMEVGTEMDIDTEGVRDISEDLAQEVVQRITNTVSAKAESALAEARSAITSALATDKSSVHNKALNVRANARDSIVSGGRARLQGRVDRILLNYPRLPEVINRSGPVSDAMRDLIAAKVAQKRADIADEQAALSERIQAATPAATPQAAAARAALNQKVKATKASVKSRLAKAVKKAEQNLAKRIESAINHTVPTHTGGSKSWIDPIFGFRARYNFTDHLYAVTKADVGGFGVGSDLTWQVFGALGYRLNEHWSTELGYKHLSVDYSKDGFVFDAAMSGVFLGLTYTF